MGKRLLYLECSMGAAGDMLMGALLELLPDKQEFLQQMNELGLAGVQVLAEPSKKCGILGTHVRVTVHGEEEASEDVQEHEHERHHHHEHASSHHHFGMAEVAAVLEASKLPERVRQQALEVYTRIGEAEAHVHGVPVEQVHFHEVGALDAVCCWSCFSRMLFGRRRCMWEADLCGVRTGYCRCQLRQRRIYCRGFRCMAARWPASCVRRLERHC